MSKDRSDRIKPHNWLIMPLMVTFAALSPEYIAPGFTIFGAIMTMWKLGIRKQKLSDFAIGYTILAFMIWMVVGAFYAKSITSPLVNLLLWAMMYSNVWVSGVWVKTEAHLEKIVHGGAFAAGIAGFIAILQYVVRLIVGEEKATIINPFWRIIDIGIEKLVSILPQALSSSLPRTTFKLFPDRSSGTFSNPLFLATFLVAMLSFCVFCLLNGKNKKEKALGWVSLLLAIGGIATSFSRGPYLYTALVFVLLLIYGGKRALKILGIGSVGALFVLIFSKSVIRRLLTLASTTDKSINARKRIWAAMFEKIPDRFIFGYGTGVDSVRSILHNEYNEKQPHAHNIFLEFQMENGIIGVLLFVAILVVFIYSAYKLYRKGGMAKNFAVTFFVAVAGLCMCGMTDCIFYGLKPLQYFMLILGLTQAAVNIYLKDDEKPFAKLQKRLEARKKKPQKTEEKENVRV